MTTKHLPLKFAISAMLISPLINADQVLFYDDFNQLDITNGTWLKGSWDLGSRTEVTNPPFLGFEEDVSYVSLPLDTYNPNSPGSKLRGAELWSLSEYTVNDGIEFSARVRAKDLPMGMICSFFTFKSDNDLQDEIDIEILTNELTDTFLATSWDNWDKSQPVFNDHITHQDTLVVTNDFDYSDWNDYAIRWYQDHIEWYINDELVNVHYDVVPDLPLRIHANFWAAGSEWAAAYDANLMPVSNSSENTRYQYQIDYIKVTRLGDTVLPTVELSESHYNGTVSLNWELITGHAHQYQVYRGKRPLGRNIRKGIIDFELIAETDTTEFSDQPGKGHWVYQVVATNETDSTISNAVSVHAKKVNPRFKGKNK